MSALQAGLATLPAAAASKREKQLPDEIEHEMVKHGPTVSPAEPLSRSTRASATAYSALWAAGAVVGSGFAVFGLITADAAGVIFAVAGLAVVGGSCSAMIAALRQVAPAVRQPNM